MPISPVSQKVKGFYSLCEMLVDILYSYVFEQGDETNGVCWGICVYIALQECCGLLASLILDFAGLMTKKNP